MTPHPVRQGLCACPATPARLRGKGFFSDGRRIDKYLYLRTGSYLMI